MRRGIVLVAVLVLTSLAGMIAAGLLFRVRAEVKASTVRSSGLQAYAAACSGLNEVIGLLGRYRDDPRVWYDNERLLKNRFVTDDGVNRWYYTVWAHDPSEPDAVRYGPIDESGKINVNFATAEMLESLPNMTPQLVDCLLDYRDGDDQPRPYGAEQDYYANLPQPYLIANGPLATIDELLLIKGFNAGVLYGEDANLSGLLEPNENDAAESFPPDNADGVLDLGLREYLTVFTPGPLEDGRIDINGDEEQLAELSKADLPRSAVRFIRLYRAEGNVFSSVAELIGMEYELKNDHDEPFAAPAGAVIRSGLTQQDLPQLFETLVALPHGTDRGRVLVNVNTAPPAVLAALPGIDEPTARQIVEIRTGLTAEQMSSPAWLVDMDVLDPQSFKTVAPYLTCRSEYFTVRCAGFAWPGGRTCVLESVVRVGRDGGQVIYQRDMTRLGLPFHVDPGELEQAG